MGAVTVNRDEVLRYLGYRRQEADDAVAELADTCLEELKRCAAAKYISRTFSMDIRGACVSFGGVAVHSDMLANHLEGCREVIAFAGTLGAPVDRLIHRYSQTTMSDSYMLTPTKSLTCLLGLTADAGSCHMVKCAACDNVGCAFRRV